MKFGVVTFPGSNGDYDSYASVRFNLGAPVEFLWHKSEDLLGSDVIILPGGFAHGDYLRAGAIARFSPIMKSVIAHAKSGGLVVGFCNGFQVLTESGLLPGALIRNKSLRFASKMVRIRVEHTHSPFTAGCRHHEVWRTPIAHGEGNYYNFDREIRELEENNQVLFRYVDAHGHATPEANPNGSVANIAGITNRDGNVLGMMPHPERAADAILGSDDGLRLFRSLLMAKDMVRAAENQ